MRKFILIGAVVAITITGYVAYDAIAGKKCTGSKNCTACKNCKACKHCNGGGGSCGVCK